MPSSLKHHCTVSETGVLTSTYEHFTDEILQEILEVIGNEPAVFPYRFLFVPTTTFDSLMTQLFLFRHIRRYKVLISQNFMILVKRRRRLRNMPHLLANGELVF